MDFIIGSKELNIDGVTIDGKTEPIFKNEKNVGGGKNYVSN